MNQLQLIATMLGNEDLNHMHENMYIAFKETRCSVIQETVTIL